MDVPAEWYRQIVESEPNALVVVDADGRIVLVNAETERLFGYPRGELLGQSVDLLVPDDLRERHPREREAFVAAPRARQMGAGRDLKARRRDGTEFPVEIGLQPLETGHGVIVLASIFDVAERKQTEAIIRASLREKEVLLQEVYHRVKNNLQVLGSLISLQERTLRDASARAALHQSATRVKAMSLVHEMLYRSERLENLELARYLDALVDHLMEAYDARGAGIRVERAVEPIQVGLETAIPLGLAVNELVSNCLKHAFGGCDGGTVHLSARRDEDGRIELSVRDDGNGLPADVDPDSAMTLGLQIVRALTGQLGGRVRFHSAAGGTEVVLRV